MRIAFLLGPIEAAAHAHLASVEAALRRLGADVRHLELPDLPDENDEALRAAPTASWPAPGATGSIRSSSVRS